MMLLILILLPLSQFQSQWCHWNNWLLTTANPRFLAQKVLFGMLTNTKLLFSLFLNLGKDYVSLSRVKLAIHEYLSYPIVTNSDHIASPPQLKSHEKKCLNASNFALGEKVSIWYLTHMHTHHILQPTRSTSFLKI